MDEYFVGYGEPVPWDEQAFVLSTLAANERMGATLAFLYDKYPRS